MNTDNPQYEVKRWAHQMAVTDAFAADIAEWKEIAKKQMREAVMRQSGAIDIELEELVDERETRDFQYGVRKSIHPGMFILYAVYSVTVPITPA